MKFTRRICSTCEAEFIDEGTPTNPPVCDACARYDAEAEDPQAAAPFLPPSDDFTPPKPGFDKPRKRWSANEDDEGWAFA